MTTDTFYVITRLHKDDIRELFPQDTKKIDALTDEDMQYIARKPEEYFVEYGGYWDVLEGIAEKVLTTR